MSSYEIYRYSCWVVSLICSVTLTAQQPFHIPFDFGYHQQQAYRVISIDSNIFVSGIALPKSTPENERSIYMARLDNQGKLTSHIIYEDDDNGHAYSNICRDMVHLGNEIFMSNSNSSNVNDFVSYELVSSYDTIEDIFRIVNLVESQVDGEISPVGSVLTTNFDNKLALTLIDFKDDRTDIIIRLIDPFENLQAENLVVLSRKNYFYYPHELLKLNNQYYVIGYLFREDIEDHSLFIAKFDKDFNLINEKLLGDHKYSGAGLDAFITFEDELIISAKQFVTSDQNQRSYSPIIIKIDKELNLLWQESFGEQDYHISYTTFFDILSSNQRDGAILLGTRQIGIDNNSVGVVGKISNEGDSIFYKHIQPLDGYYRLALYDMTVTPDGNYLATGNTWSIENQDSVFFEGVLIKFDENGNICDRNKTSTSQIHLPDIELSLYPNPASEVLYIDTGISLKTISILDSQGQLIITKNDLSPSTIYYQSVVNYPSGQYYIHITSNEGLTYIERIIIL